MKRSKVPPPPEQFAPPPESLTPESQEIWIATVSSKKMRSLPRLALFEQALLQLDRANECSKQLREEGLLTKTVTTGACHLSPLAKLERESRQLVARLFDQLALNFDPKLDGPRSMAEMMDTHGFKSE